MGSEATLRRVVRVGLAFAAAAALAGCSVAGLPKIALQPAPKPVATARVQSASAPATSVLAYAEPGPATPTAGPAAINALIDKYAAHYSVPAALIHRVVKRESNYNPRARNGAYYGLMQISHATARSMGYRGEASGLLDADTNLRYAVKYLRGAYLVADGDHATAQRFYMRGYYYDAKRRGMLDVTGLR